MNSAQIIPLIEFIVCWCPMKLSSIIDSSVRGVRMKYFRSVHGIHCRKEKGRTLDDRSRNMAARNATSYPKTSKEKRLDETRQYESFYLDEQVRFRSYGDGIAHYQSLIAKVKVISLKAQEYSPPITRGLLFESPFGNEDRLPLKIKGSLLFSLS